jgi:hypothetical protein
MPDGAAAVAGEAVRMGKGYRAILRSTGRGCGAGQVVRGRRLKPGRAVPVEDGTDLTRLALATGDSEWDAAWKAG